jgi:ABC-type Fe3+-hydroxamate transport system substrate-binding protein
MILEKLRILGNLANKSSYSYSDQEVDKIFKAIEDQLRTVKARFKPRKRRFKF